MSGWIDDCAEPTEVVCKVVRTCEEPSVRTSGSAGDRVSREGCMEGWISGNRVGDCESCRAVGGREGWLEDRRTRVEG